MSLNDFEYIKDIGKGAFARVCLAKRKSDSMTYAIKRVKISSLNSKERENALNEVRILASIEHPNLIGFKECFFDEESKTLNIVMEFADDGDIEAKIKKYLVEKSTFSEDDIWSYLIQTISGLKSLHDNNIMHRDLKSANLFITKDKMIKLGDLNVSKLIKRGMAQTQTGTPYYASPEVWADKPYDYKSDIWSVGCILYEMCCLKPPFRAKSLECLFKSVTKGQYDPIPSIYSKNIANLISIMLQTSPYKRPSCADILSMDEIKRKIYLNPNLAYLAGHNMISQPRSKDINENMFGAVNYKNINDIKQSLPKKKNYSFDE
jgi:NIMA (never in mitosis gene a)-related kinase 1/4/5